MTPRSIRRAAQRKSARKAEKLTASIDPAVPLQTPGAVAPEPASAVANFSPATPSQMGLSVKKQAANQANAQRSTGPKTEAGKAISRLNAVTSALTGCTVLLPTDDAGLYTAHLVAYQDHHRPVGLIESTLVQSLADTDWRLRRIPALEMAIYAKGRLEFAQQWEAGDLSATQAEGAEENAASDQASPTQRAELIDAHIFLAYERQLRNLHLQETRLLRRRAKESAELAQLQKDRRDQAEQHRQREMARASALFLEAKRNNTPFDPAAHGFDFSTRQIQGHIALACNPLPATSARQAA